MMKKIFDKIINRPFNRATQLIIGFITVVLPCLILIGLIVSEMF